MDRERVFPGRWADITRSGPIYLLFVLRFCQKLSLVPKLQYLRLMADGPLYPLDHGS